MLFHTDLLHLLKITDKNKIMILTGKAKKEFFNWLDNQGVNGIDISNWEFEKFHLLSNVSQNSLIIEWFDSVGIYVNSSGLTLSKTFISDVSVNDNCEYNYDGFRIRKEATEQAIKKANEIYNSTL